MNIKDRIQKKLDSDKEKNVSRDILNPDFQAEIKEFTDKERVTILYHDMRKGHYVEIGTSPQRMTAYLSLCVTKDKQPLSKQDLLMAISAAGICSGIVEDGINRRLSPDGLFTESFVGAVVARGRRPVNGRAGYLELLRRPYNPALPNALVAFDPVNEDEEVARVHPPERGSPGVDVLGEEVPCSLNVEAQYKLNHLIKTLKLGNETSLIAGARGHLAQDGNNLFLLENLNITGDLNTNDGALNYNNHVFIFGSVWENTSVNIQGNLTVKGTISSSQMHIGGDLIMEQGIFGRGGARVTVKGNVIGRYANEVRLFCDGALRISKEAINSTIWCKGRVESKGATLMGGSTFGLGGMEVQCIGSDLGIGSLVVAGLDYNEYRVEKELRPALQILEEKKDELVTEFRQSNAQRKKSLLERINELNTEIGNRKAEIESLASRMLPRNPDATIKVLDSVYPGPTVMIGFAELPLNEKIEGPMEFFLKEKAVCVRRLALR